MPFIVFTSRLGLHTENLSKLDRSGNYWYVRERDGIYHEVWDEHRNTIQQLIKEMPEDDQ